MSSWGPFTDEDEYALDVGALGDEPYDFGPFNEGDPASFGSTGAGRRAFAYDELEEFDPANAEYVDPSQSTNPVRPRTLRMGYDSGSRILELTFREGAIYHYFGVTAATWEQIKTTESPGQFLDSVLVGINYQRVS